MTAWTDLVADATNGPYIEWDVSVTEGRDWRFEWPATAALVDHNNDPIDLSLVSDGNCSVIVTDQLETSVIADAAWTWVGASDGTFALTCARASNAGKAGPTGAFGEGQYFRWRVKLVLPGTLHIDFIGGSFHIDQDGGIA